MTTLQQVRRFSDVLVRTSTTEQAALLFDKLLATYNCSGYVVAHMHMVERALEHVLFVNRWPAAWTVHYMDRGYLDHDKIAAFAMRSRVPFRWDSVDMRSDDPLARKIMNEACDHKMNYGLCIPVFHPDRKKSVVSIAFEHCDLGPDDEAIIRLAAIDFCNQIFFLKPQVTAIQRCFE